MKITIVPVDGTVIRDGVAYTELDLSPAGIPENIHALQWNAGAGTVEYTDNEFSLIKSVPTWAEAALDVWAEANEKANAPPPEPTPEERAEMARRQQKWLLSQSDWTQLPDAPVDQAAWAEYRQDLRNVTKQEGFPDDIVWPATPE